MKAEADGRRVTIPPSRGTPKRSKRKSWDFDFSLRLALVRKRNRRMLHHAQSVVSSTCGCSSKQPVEMPVHTTKLGGEEAHDEKSVRNHDGDAQGGKSDRNAGVEEQGEIVDLCLCRS